VCGDEVTGADEEEDQVGVGQGERCVVACLVRQTGSRVKSEGEDAHLEWQLRDWPCLGPAGWLCHFWRCSWRWVTCGFALSKEAQAAAVADCAVRRQWTGPRERFWLLAAVALVGTESANPQSLVGWM
jgi:hypothetical protein